MGRFVKSSPISSVSRSDETKSFKEVFSENYYVYDSNNDEFKKTGQWVVIASCPDWNPTASSAVFNYDYYNYEQVTFQMYYSVSSCCIGNSGVRFGGSDNQPLTCCCYEIFFNENIQNDGSCCRNEIPFQPVSESGSGFFMNTFPIGDTGQRSIGFHVGGPHDQCDVYSAGSVNFNWDEFESFHLSSSRPLGESASGRALSFKIYGFLINEK